MAYDTSSNQLSGVTESPYVFTAEGVAESLYGKRAVRSLTELHRAQGATDGSATGSADIRNELSAQSHIRAARILSESDRQNVKSTYAVKSFPDEAELCWSSIPGAGYGVSAKVTIPEGTWIGPYEGKLITMDDISAGIDTSYLWEIYDSGRFIGYIDGSDEEKSSWMRFIRCARHKQEQNLYLFQFKGRIFYRAFKEIAVGEELLVWYDEKYSQYMGIPTGLQAIPVTMTTGTVTFLAENKCHSGPKNQRSFETLSPNKKQRLEPNLTVVTQQQSMSRTPASLSTPLGMEVTNSEPFNTGTVTFLAENKCHSGPKNQRSFETLSPNKKQRLEPNLTVVTQQQSMSRTPASLSTPLGMEVTKDFNKFLSHQLDYQETRHLSSPKEDPQLLSNRYHETVTRQVSSSSTVSQSSADSCTSPRASMDESTEDDLDDKRLSGDEDPGPQKLTTKCRSIDDVSMWQCGQCYKTFTQRVLLQVHVCPNKPVNPYKCGHCAESFTNPTDLRVHVGKHSGEKPFKCGFCSRSFSGATTLNNHIRTHTGEKPFGCDKCGRTFAQPTHLARHMRIPGECSRRNELTTMEQRNNVSLGP